MEQAFANSRISQHNGVRSGARRDLWRLFFGVNILFKQAQNLQPFLAHAQRLRAFGLGKHKQHAQGVVGSSLPKPHQDFRPQHFFPNAHAKFGHFLLFFAGLGQRIQIVAQIKQRMPLALRSATLLRTH